MWQSRTKPSFDDAYLPHRQGPTWAMRPPTSSSSRQEKTLHDTTKHARTPHAQPRRLTTAANNDNADSTSQMSKSRRTMQELHKSAMSPPALARRPIRQGTQRERSMSSTSCRTKTSTADARRQHISENTSRFSPFLEGPEGAQQKTRPYGAHLQSRLASPRRIWYRQDSVRLRQRSRPACSTRRIAERRRGEGTRASGCGHPREPVGGH